MFCYNIIITTNLTGPHNMQIALLSLIFCVGLTLDTFGKIKPVISDIYFKAWYKFKEAGVTIPFPQQGVWFKSNLKVEIEKDF